MNLLPYFAPECLRRTIASSKNVGKMSFDQVKLSKKRTFHHFMSDHRLKNDDSKNLNSPVNQSSESSRLQSY